jgi:hypothetical protein
MVVGIVTDSYQILMPIICLIRDCRSRYGRKTPGRGGADERSARRGAPPSAAGVINMQISKKYQNLLLLLASTMAKPVPIAIGQYWPAFKNAIIWNMLDYPSLFSGRRMRNLEIVRVHSRILVRVHSLANRKPLPLPLPLSSLNFPIQEFSKRTQSAAIHLDW